MTKEETVKECTESFGDEVMGLVSQWFDSVYEDAYREGHGDGYIAGYGEGYGRGEADSLVATKED